MLVFPSIDPVALELGPLKVHWYGVMYLLAFAQAWGLATYRAKSVPVPWNNDQISDLIFYGAVGVVLGGRLGYVLFYNFSHFLQEPLWLFKVWEGGMSFHGGLLGVITALIFFSYKEQRHPVDVLDFIAPAVPLGLGLGRLGNFIGGELWGRPTSADIPWAMIFPHVDNLPRHPSQLYQMFLEGLVLFGIVFWFSARPRPRAAVIGVWLLSYGCIRFVEEFFRQPDAQLNFIAFDWLTMGQALSAPMVVAGILILVWAYRQKSSVVSQ